MHRTTSTAFVAFSLAAVLLGAACTSTVSGTAAAPAGVSASSETTSAAATTSASATKDTVEWVNDVCGALLPFIEAASTQPDIDPSDPVATVEATSAFLGDVVASLDEAVAGLKAAGPSPAVGGDKLVSRLTGALKTFRDSFADAKKKIDAIDASDPQQLATDLPEAVAGLAGLEDFPDPTADLKSNPELDRAAQKAPNCQALPQS